MKKTVMIGNVNVSFDNESDVYQVISDIALVLTKNRICIQGQELAKLLNKNGVKNRSGKPFTEGTRSIFNTLRGAYNYYKQWTDKDPIQRASAIAVSFVNKHGQYAYELY